VLIVFALGGRRQSTQALVYPHTEALPFGALGTGAIAWPMRLSWDSLGESFMVTAGVHTLMNFFSIVLGAFLTAFLRR